MYCGDISKKLSKLYPKINFLLLTANPINIFFLFLLFYKNLECTGYTAHNVQNNK